MQLDSNNYNLHLVCQWKTFHRLQDRRSDSLQCKKENISNWFLEIWPGLLLQESRVVLCVSSLSPLLGGDWWWRCCRCLLLSDSAALVINAAASPRQPISCQSVIFLRLTAFSISPTLPVVGAVAVVVRGYTHTHTLGFGVYGVNLRTCSGRL